MFETAVLSYGPPTKRVWATFAGFAGQAFLVGCALLAPLLWPQVIPKVAYVMSIAPPGSPPPPPPPGDAAVPKRARVVPFQRADNVFHEPIRIPEHPAVIVEEPETLVAAGGSKYGVPGGIDGGVPGGLVSRFLDDTRMAPVVKPPEPVKPVNVPPPPPPTVKPPTRISVVELARPIRKVEPIYPQLAKTIGISGRVDLMGVLGIDGRIHELRVVSGHPLLIRAAMDAVSQWVFAPTILNGQPVEVQAPIQVNFVLSR
jgi:protein TonB